MKSHIYIFILLCSLLSVPSFAAYAFDFRKSHWGDSIEQVKISESGNKIYSEKNDELVFNIKLLGHDALLYYTFKNGKLVSGQIVFLINLQKSYIPLFNYIKTEFQQKYTEVHNILCDDINNDPEREFSCKYSAIFKTKNGTEIFMIIFANSLSISYNSDKKSDINNNHNDNTKKYSSLSDYYKDNYIITNKYSGEGKRTYVGYVKTENIDPDKYDDIGRRVYLLTDHSGKLIVSKNSSLDDEYDSISLDYFKDEKIGINKYVKNCLDKAAYNKTQVEISGDWIIMEEAIEGFSDESVTCKNLNEDDKKKLPKKVKKL